MKFLTGCRLFIQIVVADGPCLLCDDGFVNRDEMPVFHGDSAVDHGVVHRGAQTDRAENVSGVVGRADQLQAPVIHQEEVGALADFSASISGIRAMPEESFMLETGQWAMPVPVSARRRSSASLK